ncbi:MAG: PadR family transcriptional regulator AphA [Crocinitomicaceae bacterium]|jgi:PadR family transcriptional regulator AphA
MAGYDMSLKHAILTLLETEEGSGYDLLKRFKRRLGYFWNASHQQIYLQLKKMSAEGLIEFEHETQQTRPNRKIYRVTPLGKQSLIQWMETSVKVDKVNDALLVKLYAGHLVDTIILQQEISTHTSIHQRMLNTFLALEQDYLALDDHNKAPLSLPYLTLRRGILGEQAWLAWATEVNIYLQDN